jgi:DNA-binding CsgD family transcriptional regulator
VLHPDSLNEDKLTIKDLMALPLNVYFMNQNSENCILNPVTLETCGWSSLSKARGKTVTDIWPHQMARSAIENDKGVLSCNKMKVFEEEVFNEKKFGLQALSFKFPWYDSDNNIIGIFGCSIVPDCYPFYSLGNSLAILAKTQLLNDPLTESSNTPLPTRNYFTKREIDVLKLLVRVKTSKEIATELGLSYRTVEHYIENAKRKIGVTSKSELIDKIMGDF